MIPHRIHFLLVATGAGSRFLSPPGLLCGLGGVVSGVALYSRHRDFPQASAGDGVCAFIFSHFESSEFPPLVHLPLRAQARHLRFPVSCAFVQSSQGHVLLEYCSLCSSTFHCPLRGHWDDRALRTRLLLHLVRRHLPVQTRSRLLPFVPPQKHVRG